MMPDDRALTDLAGIMRDMFPEPMGIGVADPRITYPPLQPEEIAATTGMIPARLREFTAGRHAARLAIGQHSVPIPMGADRAPIWPKGLRGSISHCDSACVAVVTSGQDLVGVDIEPDEPLAPELIDLISTEEEQVWLGQLSDMPAPRAARMLFCAKEAAYKAQYPLSGELIEFKDLSGRFAPDKDRFELAFTRRVGPFGAGYLAPVRVCVSSGFILAGVTLPAV